jgi:transposase
MPREFSEDLYWRIIYLHTDGLSTVDIANTLHMSKGVVNKIKKRYNRWACVKNPFKGVPGRRKLFSRGDMAILRNLVREKVDWYLDELAYEMECLTGKRASIAALWRSLQYLGITRKKVMHYILYFIYFIINDTRLSQNFFFWYKVTKSSIRKK